MASSQTSDTHVSATIALHPRQPQPPPIDKEAALHQLAAQAKISQLAAQLRLRLSYASYKTQNKLSNVPFSALEKRLDEETSTPKQSPSVLLLDPLSFDKSITDTQRMPPPPAPSQTLFSSILDTTDIETRPAKRQKLGPSGTARAMAPSANGFSIPHITSTDVNDHHEPKRKPLSNSSSHTKASASSHSPKKKTSSKKAPRTSLPMADKEQLAAKTLASLLVAKGSPKSPVKSRSDRSSIHEDDTSSSVAGDDRRTKTIRRAPSSVSSVDAAMADASLSVNGDASTTDGNGSGMDTVPGSPALSATQRERDSAELLLLLATSPSPARNTTRRAPLPTNRQGIEPRVLFQELSDSVSASTSGSAKSSKGLSDPLFPTSATSNTAPSSLLPAPPSPSKKSSSSSKTSEDRFMVPPTLAALGLPFHPSGNSNSGTPSTSMLQPPFTPGESLHGNPSTNFGSATAGFGTGFALGLGALGPSTPTTGLSFNMADYINFTPTPGGGFSPVQKPSTSKTGNGGSGLLAAPVSIGVQNIFAGGSGSGPVEFGTPSSLGLGAASAASPKKSDSPEKKRTKKVSLSSIADKKSEASALVAVAVKDSILDGETSASSKGATKQTNNGDPTN
ncbi:hypothetical protein CPB86DRAFT_778771, partial [Serendipita vermifera]